MAAAPSAPPRTAAATLAAAKANRRLHAERNAQIPETRERAVRLVRAAIRLGLLTPADVLGDEGDQ